MFKLIAGLIKVHPNTPKTRTFWVGVGSTVGGIANLVNCYIQGDWSQAPQSAVLILGGIGAITGRDAITKLANKIQ